MIISKDNQKLKQIRKLLSASGSKKSEFFILEGERAVFDCVKAGGDISYILVRDGFTGDVPDFPYEVVASHLFSTLTDTENPQGILALCKKHSYTLQDVGKGAILYTDGIRDPGNLGTLIRSADAFGFAAVLLSPDTVSLYNPKVIRSTMSSLFHLPIVENVTIDTLTALKENYALVGGILNRDAMPLSEVSFDENTIVIIGNEAGGIRNELQKELTIPVFIPMTGQAESLNAGVAGGILMYAVQNGRKQCND